MFFEVVVVLLVFIGGMNLPKLFSVTPKDRGKLKILWPYHLFFGIAYAYITSVDKGSDAVKYWAIAKTIDLNTALQYLVNGRGTTVMYTINYLPSGILDLSYLSLTVLYALFGYIGLCFFYKICLEVIPNNSKINSFYLFPTIFFFPTLHFWSAGVGKDTLLFTCVGIFSYSLLNIRKRILGISFTLTLSYLVRPHVTLYLLVSFALAYLINTKIPVYRRVFLSIMLAAIGIIMLPKVMEYAKIEELSLDSYTEFANKKADILSRANVGSRVDMSNYPFPLKLFTFLYRPLFFDSNNIQSLFASIENLVLLFLTYVGLRHKPIKTFKKAPFLVKGLLIFVIIGSTISSMSLGNLGIMIRMRNMFLPGLIIYILWTYSYYTEEILSQKKRKAIKQSNMYDNYKQGLQHNL